MASSEYAPAQQQMVALWETLEARGDNIYVDVDRDVLDRLAESNPELTVPDWRFPGDHPSNDWAFATQVVVSSVINFHFLNRNRAYYGEGWSMTDPSSGKVLSASNALHPSIYRVFGEAEDINSAQIMKLATEAGMQELLPRVPMGFARQVMLGSFAVGLDWHYDGSVRNLLESARDTDGNLRLFNRGEGLVERLTDTSKFGRAFFDTYCLDDLIFPFNKRANLAPVLIYGRSTTSSELPTVADIDQSGTIPDYRLPQAFRAMKAINYRPKLASQVDAWEPIPEGSVAEIEIRGATAFSTAYLLGQLNAIRADHGQSPYNMAHLDFMLWKMGRELKKNGDTSWPHFTETTAY